VPIRLIEQRRRHEVARSSDIDARLRKTNSL